MSDDQNRSTTPEEPTQDAASEKLSDDDLEDVAGGGPIYDTYLVVKDGWSDFKEGFSDAWND